MSALAVTMTIDQLDALVRKAVREELAALDAERRGPFVYFVQAHSGRIKIGRSVNPVVRLGALRSGSPEPLFLLGVMLGDFADERALHARFRACRISGEWFSPVPKLLEFIRENSRAA